MYKRSYVILAICGMLTAAWVGSAFGWTNTGGGDHGGADWIVDQSSAEIAGVHTDIGMFRIPADNTVLVKAYDGSDCGYVEIHAEVIDIAGTLQGSERGGSGAGSGGSKWIGAGGGGYGGRGGVGWYGLGGARGSTCGESGGDDIRQGSNGGDAGAYSGGKGGAGIKLVATSSLTVSGLVAANGGSGVRGGGGSGGGIYLQAPAITHSGLLQANGGNTSGTGGSGGGGRIKLYYTTLEGSGTPQVDGGQSGAWWWGVTRGEEGTITHDGELPATLIAVRKDTLGGAYGSITAAIRSIRYTLPTAYIVEIQDSETYLETVRISKNTSPTKTLTIRAQAGQTPRVVAQRNHYGAITIFSHYVTVEGLILEAGSRERGVQITWGSYNTVRNCTVYGAEGWSSPGIHIHSGRHNEIVGNMIYDSDIGILIYGFLGDNNIVRNNLIHSNRDRGIWIYRRADDNIVINNTLYRNGVEIHLGHGGATRYNPGHNNTFRNNVMYARSNGVCFAADQYRDPGTLPAGTVSEHNNLYAAELDAHIARMDTTVYDDLESWRSVSGGDRRSLSTDPLFVDAPMDFHLQSTAGSHHGGAWTPDPNQSPCIDAGNPADDFENEPDPNGHQINMGAYGNTSQASKSGAPEPFGEFNRVVQEQDGTGETDVSIEAGHPDGWDMKARIEWSDAQDGTYTHAALLGPCTVDYEDSGGPADVCNDCSYQVGSDPTRRIVTSEGNNTVTFLWDAMADLPNGDGTYWLRLTVNDDLIDQSVPDKISVTIDNAGPSGLSGFDGNVSTASTITYGWTPASNESHFDHYEIWYGTDQDDVIGRTGTAAEWDAAADTALNTMSTNATTITGLQGNTLYYAKIWAADQYGNEEDDEAVVGYSTVALDTVTHYVAKSGSDPGVSDDPSHPWLTIQQAMDDIPADLIAGHTYYIVQVQDSETYGERVMIGKTTDEIHAIALRAAPGQTPKIQPPDDTDGILIQSPYVTIEGFEIDASNNYGINADSTGYTTIRNCTLYGGTAIGGGGIKLYMTDHNRIVDNRIYSNRIGIYLAQNADSTGIRGNLILDNEYGVYVDQDADADTLINNAIVGCAKGLHFVGGQNPVGINHVVRNNIFHELDVCIYLGGALGNTFDQCDYNDLHPTTGGNVGYISGTTYGTLAEWRGGSGMDSHSIEQDPLFADVSGDPGDMDLHLKSPSGRWDGSGWVTDPIRSPCIDAGDPSDEYSREPTLNGDRINIGAYGNTEQASKSGGVTAYKTSLPYDDYVMIGVPLIPESGNPDSVLGDDFPGEGDEDPWGYWWRLLRWDSGTGTYVHYHEPWLTAGEPPDFHPGRGYWLKQWWSIEYENGTTEGDTISVTGWPVPLDTDFIIPLQFPEADTIPLEYPGAGRGVNQLANPFMFSIDWQDAKVRNNTTGVVHSISEAADAGWVDGHAYRWDWENDYYIPIFSGEGGIIEQWTGFWVEQLDPTLDLSLLLPPTPAETSSSQALASTPSSPTDWYLQFSVGCSPLVATDTGTDTVWYRDDYNRIGVNPEASRQYDPHDAVDLGTLSEHYVYAFFPHDDPDDPETYWPERPDRYTYDIRDPEWVDQVWTFVVETDLANTEMTWTWLNSGALPRGYHVSLEDGDADSVVISDIRVKPWHIFSSGASGERTFRLRAMYEDVRGDVTGDRTVSAYDATQILRHVIGLEPLPDFALELANVSGNLPEDLRKAVTPYDAALILRYVVGLLGDFPADGGEAPKSLQTERIVQLSAPAQRADGTYSVSLLIDEMDGVLSGLARVHFDAAVMNIEDVKAGELASEYLFVHTIGEGVLTLAFAGTYPERGEGTFAEIVVRPKRSEEAISEHLNLRSVQLNEGLIRVQIPEAQPEAYCLYPGFPNPFNPSTAIRFDLPVQNSVRLSIYNTIGQQIRKLVHDDLNAGTYEIIWDSRDQQERPVASGVYLCRLIAGDYRAVRKLVLVR